MASNEDIIRHIIRDIVSQSTTILKKRRSLPPVDQADPSSLPPAPPLTPLPQITHLFAAGIKSHHTPYMVSDTLAAFMVRAVVLDPRNDFRIERELSKEEVQRLILMCVEKITEVNSPIMETVKMQVYFDTTFPAQATLETQPTFVSSGKQQVSIPFFLKEKTIPPQILQPPVELSAFITLSRAEKEAQLNGLTQLVTGIRLFNKQLGKGGEAVDDVIELCASELQELTSEVGIQTTQTEGDIQEYLAIIDSSSKNVDSRLTPALLERIKSSLIFRRQYLMYLDALQEQLERTRQSLQKLGENFDEIIRDLKSTCKAKTAVPVDQVYPQFIALANLWTKWMDELFYVAFRRGILDTIHYHSKCFDVPISKEILDAVELYKKEIEPEILPESDIVMKASELMAAIAIINKTVEVIHPGNTTQYFKLPVEYGGFCPYTLIRRDGVVVPGDKNLGLLRYRDRLFAFATSEAAREFSKYPDRYMEGVLEMAKKLPDLVQLLHLYSYFPTVDALENAKSFTRQRLLGQMPMVSEAGTQVDTHIVDSKFDSKYQWNEWELRRQALMLDSSNQTTTESSTNVPKKVNYLAGLRNDGKAKNKFKVVDLTVDL
ncbi:hypothetical protein BC829DRAFT_447634 [Chytridium lagenaria]|nr:hypothetical protein BC829DRAFT_447634 [Chytridium lagenaria]